MKKIIEWISDWIATICVRHDRELVASFNDTDFVSEADLLW